MVSNFYLDDVLKSFNSFKGTFSSNNIPFLKEGESVICNFSRVGEVGTHFIFLHNKNNTLHYFDSLKLPIIPEDVTTYFLLYQNVDVISQRIQHPNSSFCGFFCVLAFLACNLDVDFFTNDVLKVFKECVMENDSLCIKLIQILYPISLKKNKENK
jgi:hypothetical protein